MAVAAALAVWTAVGAGQLRPSPPHRAIIQDVGLPAIDRGLRAQDPPRAARTGAEADRFTKDGVDRLPYLPGSIIVKFKDDPDDFDLMAIPMAADPARATRDRSPAVRCLERWRD